MLHRCTKARQRELRDLRIQSQQRVAARHTVAFIDIELIDQAGFRRRQHGRPGRAYRTGRRDLLADISYLDLGNAHRRLRKSGRRHQDQGNGQE